MGDKLLMTAKERTVLYELQKNISGEQTLVASAKKCRISYRQMQRLKKKYLRQGVSGICHQGRGKTSNRALPTEHKKTIISIYSEKYKGFGPVFASEKLGEDGYPINKETLRLWLLEKGLWTKRKKRSKHKAYREPKKHFGEMLQIDGSFHDWFETGELNCLMVIVDDSTSHTLALLSKEETTAATNQLLKLWIENYGIPLSIYTDKKSVYYTDREPTIEESLAGKTPLTNFGKSCNKLGIKMIAANSPQAKGRVERKNAVFQDRFVKELKLRGIKDIESANKYLLETFLNDLNNKFAKEPKSKTDYHRTYVKEEISLNAVFSREDLRTVKNDWTVRHNNTYYQIKKNGGTHPPAKSKVLMQKRLDGSLHILYRGKEMSFVEIKSIEEYKQYQIKKQTETRYQIRKPIKPSQNHPWRKPFISQNRNSL